MLPHFIYIAINKVKAISQNINQLVIYWGWLNKSCNDIYTCLCVCACVYNMLCPIHCPFNVCHSLSDLTIQIYMHESKNHLLLAGWILRDPSPESLVYMAICQIDMCKVFLWILGILRFLKSLIHDSVECSLHDQWIIWQLRESDNNCSIYVDVKTCKERLTLALPA